MVGYPLYLDLTSHKLSPVIFKLLELNSHFLLQVASCVNFYYWMMAFVLLTTSQSYIFTRF